MFNTTDGESKPLFRFYAFPVGAVAGLLAVSSPAFVLNTSGWWAATGIAWLILVASALFTGRSLAKHGPCSRGVRALLAAIAGLSVVYFTVLTVTIKRAPLTLLLDGLQPLLAGCLASTLYAAALLPPAALLCLLTEELHRRQAPWPQSDRTRQR